MNSKISSLIATMILVILMLLQMCPVISFAIDEVLNNDADLTNIENVKFDVYFADERREAEYNLSEEEGEIILFAKVQVKEAGYLDNIVIDFSSCNFNVELAEENEIVQSLENNKLKLNKISKDEERIISLKVSKKEFEKMQMDDLYRVSYAKISGKYTNGEGNEEILTAEKEIKVSYVAELESELSVEISKYIPVLTVAGNKLMLQEKINSKIANDKMPIRKTQIELEIPEIEGKLPEEIRVVGESGATNGDKLGEEFEIENYSYDIEKKVVTIEVENKKEIADEKDASKKEEFAVWTKDEIDEYLVTFIYDEEVLEKALENEEIISVKANSKIEVLDEKNTVVEKELNGEVPLSGEIGSIVSGKVETKNQINKGYMITNTKALEENRKETEYKTEYEVEIGYSDVVDRVDISIEEDGYVRNDREEVLEGSTYIKEIILNKEEVKKLLGEDGNIKLVSNDVEVYKINKDLWDSQENNISLDISKLDLSKLTLVTSNVKEEGKLRIDTLKAIKADNYYSEEEIEEISKIRSREKVEVYNEDNKISEKEEFTETEVIGTELKASLSIDREKLSTVKTNEKVKMTTILETNSIDDKLFKNPSIEITMPKSFEKIENIEANVYFDDELVITNGELIENDDGTKIIKVNLEGMQTKYNLVSSGTVVDIISDITINKLTPSKDEEIKLDVINENEVVEVLLGEKIEAPEGITLASTIKKEDGTVLVDTMDNKLLGALDKGAAEYTLKFEHSLLNNSETDIEEAKIMFEMPIEEAINLDTGTEFGNNVNMHMSSFSQIPNVKYVRLNEEGMEAFELYRTENINASEDLSLESNGWGKDEVENAKKYMLVANENVKLKAGESIVLKYDVTVPAHIVNNIKAYSQVAVYSSNLETIYSKELGLESGDGAEFKLTLTSDIQEGEVLKAGEIHNFKVKVENSSSIDGEDVILNLGIPNNMKYVEPSQASLLGYSVNTENIRAVDNELLLALGESEDENVEEAYFYKEIHLGRVKANESVEYEYKLMANAEAEDKEVRLYNFVRIDNLAYYSNIISFSVEKEILTSKIYSSISDDSRNNNAMVGEEITLNYQIGTTDGSNEKHNTILTIDLPEELKYTGYEIKKFKTTEGEIVDVKVSNEGNRYTFNIGNVNIATSILSLKLKVNDFSGNNKKTLAIPGKVVCDEDQEGIDVSVNTIIVNRVAITITQTCDISERTKVKAGENYTYTFIVKNESNVPMSNLGFENIFPENTTFIKAEYKNEGGISEVYNSTNNDNNPYINFDIVGNETITIKIYVRAGKSDTEKLVSSQGIVYEGSKKLAESNVISLTLEKNNSYVEGGNQEVSDSEYQGGNSSGEDSSGIGETDFSGDGEVTGNQRISGLVWEDLNKDGKRDSNEKLMQDITVVLLNANSGKLVRTGKTDSRGQYTFSGIGSGNYSVVFLYDSSKYSSTIYRAKGVDATINSDAIDSKVSYQGQIRMAGVTEIINVSNENIYNIDIGLAEYQAFDLRIEKRVKTIQLTYNGKSTTYNYGTNFAKADVPAKEANGTTIIITYEIIVTNEGKIEGTADIVRDNVPNDLRFSAELNKDWYEGTGGVYSNALGNTVINPGESKALTLVLTKKMNSDGYGLINNTAEIVKSSNSEGKDDIDSVAGNNNSEEDDLSNANVLISVKTGKWSAYILLTISLITVVIVSIITVKKKIV